MKHSFIKKCLGIFCLMPIVSTYALENTETYTQTISRSYTTTTVTYPQLCKSDKFAKSCQVFTNYYVSRFEHNYISYITNLQDFDSDDVLYIDKGLATQSITFEYRVIKKYNFATVIAHVAQEFENEHANFSEIFNFDLTTSKNIHFADLFENKELAAMICKNKVEDALSNANFTRLPLILAQIEVNPKNFLILPDGIEFLLSSGEIRKKNIKDRVFVSLDELQEAKPIKQWFPALQESN